MGQALGSPGPCLGLRLNWGGGGSVSETAVTSVDIDGLCAEKSQRQSLRKTWGGPACL